MGEGHYIVITGGERYGDMRFFGPFYYERDAMRFVEINQMGNYKVEQLEKPE